jgi:hypothetical protein
VEVQNEYLNFTVDPNGGTPTLSTWLIYIIFSQVSAPMERQSEGEWVIRLYLAKMSVIL